ncbi:MAG: serine hydrolase [Bacilli bacterium]|nr:serine hydrolase [Bacilli bacterium]
MKKLYIVLSLIFCVSFLYIPNKNIVYAKNNNIDYDSVSKVLEKDIKENHIPGMAVIVVNSDEVIFSKTYGNCENIDTPFIIGSMSKSFTALSIMKLVEENKIDINKSISTYIDTSLYFKNKGDGDKITVKQLLNQNSGIGTYQKLGKLKITKNYGKYEYANANYNLLGKIIESVSNESYSDYVTKNIFEPLKMNHTSATLAKSNKNGLIKGYQNYFGIPIAETPSYPTDDNSWIQVPAGFISSSASDLGKYLQMYLNQGLSIITDDSINKMFYDNIPQDDMDRDYYGMGWVFTKYYSKPVLTHSGLVENYTSKMFIIPEYNIGIVVLVNMNDYLVTNNLLEDIVKPILGEEKPDVPNNLYLKNHLLLDVIYLVVTLIAIYPIVTIKKWKTKNKTKKLYIIDFVRHLIFPLLLILLPVIIKVPFWVIWNFVKDLALILIINSILLFSTGIYKIVYLLKKRNSNL